MTIAEVYTKYFVPKHLARHMMRVAAVGEWIGQQSREEVRGEEITKTLLLHDMGNLLKFDLERGMKWFEESEQDKSYWQAVLLKMRARYGSNEHQATQAMAREIGVSEQVLYLLANMGSSNLDKTLEANDLNLKIVSYADFRVAPTGFVSVRERFDDIESRYRDSSHVLADREKTKQKRDWCLQLEKQVAARTGVDLNGLSWEELESRATNLQSYIISL